MRYQIGTKIKQLRESLGLNQTEFASMIGVSNSRVSNWEKGINRPDVDLLSKICEVLHVSADDLLELNNDISLNAREQILIKNYKELSNNGRLFLDNTLKNLIEYESSEKQQQTEQKKKAEFQALKEEPTNTAISSPDNIIQFYDEKQNHEQQVELNYRTGGAGAGLGVDADNVDMIQVSYPADRVPAGANYVIPVSGDSMEPTFFDGDVLFFDLGNDCLKIGDIGIFVLNGETLVKELGENELISHNPKYKPIKIHEWDSVRIEGKVLGKM